MSSRIVSFPLVKDSAGMIIYPDDKSLFFMTTIDGLNIVAKYIGTDITIPDGVYPIPPQRKTVYTMVEFIDKIPKALRVQIRAEDVAYNADVMDWMFIVSLMNKVDLNNLPQSFIDGLDNMVANPNISLTQNQVDTFLER